jgi:hypothetical protein
MYANGLPEVNQKYINITQANPFQRYIVPARIEINI